MQHQRAFCGQVVKHGGGFVKKQRQVVFNARRCQPRPHVFVHAASCGVAIQQLAPAVAEFAARRFIHGELPPGQQAHFGHGVKAALGIGVEHANAVDLIVKHIHTIRLQRPHGKQIDQAAAHGIFTGADHLPHMGVARHGQLRLERRFIQLLPLLEVKGVAGQKSRRRQPIQHGGGRDQHHIGAIFLAVLTDAPQRGQSLADQILMGAEVIVRQGFPIGEKHATQRRLEKRQFAQQALGVGRIGRHDGGAAASRLVTRSQLRQQGRIGTGKRARQGIALAGGELR